MRFILTAKGSRSPWVNLANIIRFERALGERGILIGHYIDETGSPAQERFEAESVRITLNRLNG